MSGPDTNSSPPETQSGDTAPSLPSQAELREGRQREEALRVELEQTRYSELAARRKLDTYIEILENQVAQQVAQQSVAQPQGAQDEDGR